MSAARKSRRSARQLFHTCLVDGRVDDGRVRQVARRLAESRRRTAIRVFSEFLRSVRLDRDRHRASVETATSLPDDLREGVKASLARLYGSGLHLTFTVDRGLIGGMRIKVGSDVYDGTVRARLAAIEARL